MNECPFCKATFEPQRDMLEHVWMHHISLRRWCWCNEVPPGCSINGVPSTDHFDWWHGCHLQDIGGVEALADHCLEHNIDNILLGVQQ